MQNMRKSIRIPLVLLAVVMLTFAVTQTFALKMNVNRPTTVATIRLSTVIEGLDQWNAAKAELAAMDAKIEDLEQKWKDTNVAFNEEAESLDDSDEAKRQALEERYLEARYQFSAQQEAHVRRADTEMSLLLQQVEQAIKQELKKLCEIEGIDIVLIDDSQLEISATPSQRVSLFEQIKQKMASRRIAYINEEIVDITDQLIDRMNNAFVAGMGNNP